MDMFAPSIILAIFPYIFMGICPIVGLVLVTNWVLEDLRRAESVQKRAQSMEKISNARN
jgi:hypothetical protein